MRAFNRALAALAILTTAAPANAESDFYLSLSGMYFVPTDFNRFNDCGKPQGRVRP